MKVTNKYSAEKDSHF